jgi:hypothetical protein
MQGCLLTLQYGGSGKGLITGGSGYYPKGTTLTLTARAYTGSVFSRWSGECDGKAVTCRVKIDSNITVRAEFGSK